MCEVSSSYKLGKGVFVRGQGRFRRRRRRRRRTRLKFLSQQKQGVRLPVVQKYNLGGQLSKEKTHEIRPFQSILHALPV